MKQGDYDVVMAPPGWPGRTNMQGRVYAHRAAYWAAFGICPGPCQVVHHIDGNKRNNDPSNLELLDRHSHASLHNTKRGRLVHGTMNGYSHYRCRCDLCRDKWNAWHRKRI